MLGGIREEGGEVHRADGSLQATRLFYLAYSSRSRHEGVLFPVRVQTDDSSGSYWQRDKDGYQKTKLRSRTGVKLTVAETRGEELE